MPLNPFQTLQGILHPFLNDVRVYDDVPVPQDDLVYRVLYGAPTMFPELEDGRFLDEEDEVSVIVSKVRRRTEGVKRGDLFQVELKEKSGEV